MKNKFLIALSAMMIFGLVAAAFAYTRTTTNSSVAHCPMINQTASADNPKDSCCGSGDCCKDGKCSMGGACCKEKDSCPMKKNAESKDVSSMDMSNVPVVGGGEDCCQKGAACCKSGGACCKGKKS